MCRNVCCFNFPLSLVVCDGVNCPKNFKLPPLSAGFSRFSTPYGYFRKSLGCTSYTHVSLFYCWIAKCTRFACACRYVGRACGMECVECPVAWCTCCNFNYVFITYARNYYATPNWLAPKSLENRGFFGFLVLETCSHWCFSVCPIFLRAGYRK